MVLKNIMTGLFVLILSVGLFGCNSKSNDASTPITHQYPIDFQTIVAADRIYRVVVDDNGNPWHWVSPNHHQDPQGRYVYTNSNLPTIPQRIEKLSNVVSISLADGIAIAVTGDGLCFTWNYCELNDSMFVYNEPKQISTVKDVKYAYYSSDIIYPFVVVHKNGTAEYYDIDWKFYRIKMPSGEKIKYLVDFMILSETGKVYCAKVNDSNNKNADVDVYLVRIYDQEQLPECEFIQLFSANGSIFQRNGKQRGLSIEAGGSPAVWAQSERKTNIKFWGNSFYNMRHIRSDGVLLDCLGGVVSTEISDFIYLSGDLYLRADGILFESVGGQYEESSVDEGNNIPRSLSGDKLHRIDNIRIYTTNLVDNLPKITTGNSLDDNRIFKGIYVSQ